MGTREGNRQPRHRRPRTARGHRHSDPGPARCADRRKAGRRRRARTRCDCPHRRRRSSRRGIDLVARRGLPAAGSGQLAGLASRCARVWERLPDPNAGWILLTMLAASALDDPHALDRSSPVATGVLRLLGHELPESAEMWRATWEEHGVDCDLVSSRVLVLNLSLEGDAPCDRSRSATSPP